MNDYDYAREKLRVAVDSFDGKGSEREQLLNALVSVLGRIFPDCDLPPEIREEFEQMMKVVTKIRTKKFAGGYETNLNIMSDEAVGYVISQVRNFYDVVCSHREPEY